MRDLYLHVIETAQEVSFRRAAHVHEFMARSGTDTQPPADLQGKRIIVADDNHDLVESLMLLLELDGHKVYGTHDGMGAIRLAKALKPDVLLLDIAMPHLNGYEVARQIRARSWGVDMQIVAITGSGRPEDRSRAFVAGCDFHLTKPIRPEMLSGILAQQCATARRRPDCL
jgi:CheY-like chemotaxis protein